MAGGDAPPTKSQVSDALLGDRYELVERIGSGGMAEVWRAKDTRLERDVAVKLLPAAATVDPGRRRRIEREARALAVVNHPNILAVYDVGTAEDRPFLVTELVEGPDLHVYLGQKGKLPVDEATGIARDVLGAVGRAHEAGVVHGDLKPANILMSPHGPKVADFGVSRILNEETGTTTVAATPRCAAPEVLRGARPTAASDVYSAACVLFEMLAGRPPYEGENGWDLAAQHVEGAIPSVRQFRPEVAVGLDEAIRRALSKDPRKRFRSPDAFADALGMPAPTKPVPIAAIPAPAEPTEALTARPNAVAPLSKRWRNLRHETFRSPVFRAVTAVAVLIVLLVLVFSLQGTASSVVPDVRGTNYRAAAAVLRQAGFHVKDTSYRRVTTGDNGSVLETIPAAGKKVARGSDVYIVAGLVPPTPAPTAAPVAKPEPKDEHARARGKHKHED